MTMTPGEAAEAPQTAAPAEDFIRDVTEADFMAEVIGRSMQAPVIVNIWAPWCGTCKTFGPQLEAEVARHKGSVHLARINVAENRRVAVQLRVQSLPTVYAFFRGRPVGSFQDAPPQSQIREFVGRQAALMGDDGGLADALAAAEMMLDEGAPAGAAAAFAVLADDHPGNAEAWGGLIRAHLAACDPAAAAAAMARVPAALAASLPVEAARARMLLATQAAEAGPLAALRARVEADPADQQARFDYARALHADDRIAEGIEVLLDSFRRDRDWNAGAVRAQLLTIFDSLKPADPLVQKSRRRLSSLMFAS